MQVKKIEYVEVPFVGKVNKIDPGELIIPIAVDFLVAIGAANSCHLVACYRVDEDAISPFKRDDEIIIFDTFVEVGQQPAFDIRARERLAVQFSQKSEYAPWVYTLRLDFPSTPHMNNMAFRIPKCLCIYEKTYDELKLEWRSAQFLQDIRGWLKLTGENKLHQDNQPLEPFFINTSGYIILPSDIRENEELFVYPISKFKNQVNLLLLRQRLEDSQDTGYIYLPVEFKPRMHGVLGFTPGTMWDLQMIFAENGMSLFDTMKETFNSKLVVLSEGNKHLLDKKIIFLLKMPKVTLTEEIAVDFFVFLSNDSIRDIGLKLNFYVVENSFFGPPFPALDVDENNAKKSIVFPLIPQFKLERNKANELSGLAGKITNTNLPIVLIGAGAVGSQVLANSIKKGLGNWSVIDEDIMLPHNLVRHVLNSRHLLQSKAEGLFHELNAILSDAPAIKSYWTNYLHPEDENILSNLLAEAKIILDISTSIAVARDLAARKDLAGRRISIFLNPSGCDLVIIAEDALRQLTLDILEFQYYRSLLYAELLATHLAPPVGEVRYAGGCRDVTSRIPPEFVTIHGAIASKKLEQLLVSEESFIGVWHVDESTLSVMPLSVTKQNAKIIILEEWAIIIDSFILDKIDAHRLERLPNETGGIMIGGYDLSRKRIYIMDSILSPSDSEEYPTSYIRGIDGVEEKIIEIDEKTASHLKYIGEWHSHPEHHALTMSDKDKVLFRSIKIEMDALGFPTLMLIAGDNGRFELYDKI